ncbi:MAG TPA: HAD-IIIA family hydrolase [Solirubrobacteraceae bacterium]|nr:HAD-IIIA family hydrolase [Solirubrobacteraceae bacterium]
MSGRPAAFLDRDGVLNELVPDPASGDPESPLRITDVRLITGAAAAARELAEAGYLLVCVTNQPAAAKGVVTVAQLHAIHGHVLELLDREGARIGASRLCMHHPLANVPSLSGPCDCRKPEPGMLLDAATALGLDLAASWMFGDSETDVTAGQRAGCHTALIENRDSAHRRSGDVRPDLCARDLAEAVARVLDQPRE